MDAKVRSPHKSRKDTCEQLWDTWRKSETEKAQSEATALNKDKNALLELIISHMGYILKALKCEAV